MLSILICCYNYDATFLVKELRSQIIRCNIDFELLVYDDASKSEINKKNEVINSYDRCTFKTLPKNLGRSNIRNLLAKDAQFKHLLFLDVDVYPKTNDFITNYLESLQDEVVYGGVINEMEPPKSPYKLRWLYTKERERHSINSANFMIRKEVFDPHKFDTTITRYGYEDVLFFKSLKQKGVKIKEIDNPVIHKDHITSKAYIEKINLSLKNLKLLTDQNKISQTDSRIFYSYKILKRYKLTSLVKFMFRLTRGIVLWNFKSAYPSLLLFDFYRLGYFCTLKSSQ